MTVLILSAASDAHALAVKQHLEELGTASLLWRFSDFVVKSPFSFSIDSSSVAGRIQIGNEQIELDSISSIWFRRPGGYSSFGMPEKWIEQMIENESKHALGGILRSLKCTMINHPTSDAESRFKIRQLTLAKEIGFAIPDTLVTSDPEAAAEFCGASEASIYKLIAETSNFYFPPYDVPAGIPALPIRSNEIEKIKQVSVAPHLFQRRVQKAFDVRVTGVGEKLFALKIESQTGESKLDWRLDYSVPMTSLDLPDEVADRCLKMMRRMRLNYAAFDFCFDQSGAYVFLELNCAGQYLWVEDRANLPISKEIALLLAGRSTPLVS